MTTTMNRNALDLIDAQLAAASTPRQSNKKPLFLFLKEGHKALVRPLYDLKNAVILSKHNKWSEDRDQRVNAICAREIGKECVYCEAAANDKKLTAGMTFYLPVYVYSVVDQATGERVTYKENVDGQEVTKPVCGGRLLELSSYGTVGQILKYFREFTKDTSNGAITGRDFSISQVGSGQKKSFSVINKDPKPVDPRIAAKIPTYDQFCERILEALPPVSPTAMPSIDDELDPHPFLRNDARDAVAANVPQEIDDVPEF